MGHCGFMFRDKSKEGCRINFRGFNFHDCCAVGHALRDPFPLMHVHTLVVIIFSLGELFVTVESTTKDHEN